MLSEKINSCECQLEALVIPRRKVESLVALTILIILFTFVAGYFIGYSKATDQLCIQEEQQLFSDTIEQSLTHQFGSSSTSALEKAETEDAQKITTPSSHSSGPEPSSASLSLDKLSGPTTRYQALLFGGTKKQVDDFVKKMNTFNLPVEARMRESTTKKGSKYVWYQAVTSVLGNKTELITVVDEIKRRGHLKEVRIIEIG